MPEVPSNIQPTPAAPIGTPVVGANAAAAAPAPQVRGITINGRKLPFQLVTNTRGKGEDKGAPVLLPKYLGTEPTFGEVTPFVAALGDNVVAKILNIEIFKSLFLEASKASRKKAADGTWTIDEGVFANTSLKLVVEYTNTQSQKAQWEAERDKLAAAITSAASEMLKAQMEGRQLDKAELNRINQLFLAKAELDSKLAKKPKAVAAPTVIAAPAAAPAVPQLV